MLENIQTLNLIGLHMRGTISFDKLDLFVIIFIILSVC